MDNTYHQALQWLITDRTVTTQKEYEDAANAVIDSAKKYPMHYREFPRNEVEIIQKEIFQADCVCRYMEKRCTGNPLVIYQQDVVRKLTKLRRLQLEGKV